MFAFLMSRGFLVTVATSVFVLVVVNRVGFLRDLICGPMPAAK